MRAAGIAPGATAVHGEAPHNVIVEGRVKTPGFDAKVAGAARRIAVDIRSRRQNALPLEPRAAHAAWDPTGQRVTLHCTTQMPHAMRTIIAELIGMPESELRVIAPDVGGGFGQKMSLARGIRAGDVARAQAQDVGGVDGGPARKPRGLLP